MKKDTITRRNMLRDTALLGLAGLVPASLLACGKKELSCSDTSGLSPAETSLRTSLAYVDKSGDTSKTCSNCTLYKAAAPEQCGSCNLVKGKIHPGGYCNSWAKRT